MSGDWKGGTRRHEGGMEWTGGCGGSLQEVGMHWKRPQLQPKWQPPASFKQVNGMGNSPSLGQPTHE